METTVRSRLEAAGRESLTPLVGRAQEIGLLRERWAQVKEGLGQVVLLSGESGIGRSRLGGCQVIQISDCRHGWHVQHLNEWPRIVIRWAGCIRFVRDRGKSSVEERFLPRPVMPQTYDVSPTRMGLRSHSALRSRDLQ